MRKPTFYSSQLLRGAMCLALLCLAGAPLAWSQDAGADDQPVAATARKKATGDAAKPVNSNDLMSAMRQSLVAPAPSAAPSAPSSVPSQELPPPPVASSATAVPPPAVGTAKPAAVASPPPAPAAVVKAAPPAVPSEPITPSTPPAPPVDTPTAAKANDELFTPAPKDGPSTTASAPVATPAPAATTTTTTTTTTQTPAKIAPPAAPETTLSTGGAPLLSDMDDAPRMLGAPPTGEGKGRENAPAASAAVEDNAVYAPSRPLFGKKGVKRIGVAAKKKSADTGVEPVSITAPTPAIAEAAPEQKPAQKSQEQPASATVAAEKTAEPPAAAPAENPGEKPAEKIADSTTDKPSASVSDQPVEITAEKPVQKAAEHPIETPPQPVADAVPPAPQKIAVKKNTSKNTSRSKNAGKAAPVQERDLNESPVVEKASPPPLETTEVISPPPPPSAPPVATEMPMPATAMPAAPRVETDVQGEHGMGDSSSSGSMTAPPAAAMAGTVMYSQKPGEQPPLPTSLPVLPSTPDKPPIVSAELMPSNEGGPDAPRAAASTSMPLNQPPQPVPPLFPVSSGHASCGAANGVGAAIKPADNLCTQGTPSEVSGRGPWKWSCTGEKRGSAACSAPFLVNGECGLANGAQAASAPLHKMLCASGKPSEVSGKGPWYWNCFGEHGGAVAQCASYTLISGACGPANRMPASAAPASGLCNAGKETSVSGNGPWTWGCVGSEQGASVTCMAPARLEGACGPANGMGASEKPGADLCASGTASPVTGHGPWMWSCGGDNGGAIADCAAPLAQNAACGPAHGMGVPVRPVNDLCASGMASEVSGPGPWSWTCYGANGGARVDCMAPLKLDGMCGPVNHAVLDQAPMTDLCASGLPGAVIGSGPWQWTCQGSGGGLTPNCMADRMIAAACGTAHGVGSPTAPVNGLCAGGNPTSVIGSGPWLWTCDNGPGTTAVNCMAPIMLNGACGGAADQPQTVMPVSDLCRAGMPSTVMGVGPWNWSCQGNGGGVSASCRALLMEASAVPPPPPPAASASPVADIPPATMKAGNDCVPTVKRWTITCQQGGYPATYAGVIVGETQTLCPTNVERGVWLSNSCAASTNSAPVSPSPGILLTPPSPNTLPVTSVLPDVSPLPAKNLKPGGRLATPRFNKETSAVVVPIAPVATSNSVVFAPGSDGLDGGATQVLDNVVAQLQGDSKTIITLNAYAAMPASNDQQEAQRMSLARALAVRNYLMSRGIPNNRIDVRALGPANDSLGSDRVDIKVGG